MAGYLQSRFRYATRLKVRRTSLAVVDLMSLVGHREPRTADAAAAAAAAVWNTADVSDVSVVADSQTRLAGEVAQIADDIVAPRKQ